MGKLNWALGAFLIALTAAPTVGAEASKNRSEFVVANGPEPSSLDPAAATTAGERRLSLALFEGLIIPDARTGAPRPGLATRWTVDGTGRIYTFFLRKTTWSDGTPVLAQDVVESWLRSPEASSAKARAIDSSTLAVEFTSPLPSLATLASPAWSVVPVRWLATHPEALRNGPWVGNGPFVLESWSPRSHITLVPNPKYWDATSVKLDRIRLLFDDDARAALRRYENREVDWLPEIPLDRWSSLRDRRDFQRSSGLETAFVRVNLSRPSLQDPRVRQALSQGFDRNALIGDLNRLDLIPLSSWSAPLLASSLRFDPTAAQRLMAAAGYPAGKGFPSLAFSYPTGEKQRRVAESLRDQWGHYLGIDVQLVRDDWKVFFDRREQGDYDLGWGAWVAEVADPLSVMSLWSTKSPHNHTQFADAAFDTLLAKALALSPGNERTSVLQAADARLVAGVPAIALWSTLTGQLIDTRRWEGWWPNTANLHPWKNLARKR